MALYEHVFLVRQDVSAQQVEAIADQYKAVIESNGGSVKKVENWGLRALAYRVKKNRKAHYVLFNLDAPHAAVAEMERQMRINEDVLRFMTLKVETHEEAPSVMMQKRDRDERNRKMVDMLARDGLLIDLDELQAKHPETAGKVKFYIGDVRNPQSIRDAMPGVDYIFHAAALKQVPSCEFFPMQAVQTNIIGTDNVLHAAIDAGVKRVVCLSTDKAAYPINAMGISKAMMEHVIYANARVAAERGGTTICCTRYGNVMCSRGSVIPLFIDQIRAGNPITITDPNMTRFLMNLDEAVDLVMFAFEHANPGDLFIQKSDASTIGDLAKAVQQLFGDTGTNIIGTRHGEKLFETLMTREERLRSEDMGGYYRVAADNRDLNYDKFVVKGEVHTMADDSYTSHNTHRLDVEGTVKKILTTDYVRNALKEMEAEKA